MFSGKHSTQDEYGTAAYKTVELDTYLNDKPIQHREVQGYESDMFMTYFPNGITLMEGGADTGFRHVPPESYEPRLLQLVGGRKDVVVSFLSFLLSWLGVVFLLIPHCCGKQNRTTFRFV